MQNWHDSASKVLFEGRCGRGVDAYCCLDEAVECGLIVSACDAVRSEYRCSDSRTFCNVDSDSILKMVVDVRLLQLIDDEFGNAVYIASFIAISSSVPKKG